MSNDRPVTVSFRVIQSPISTQHRASWEATVDGHRIAEWYGDEREGFLFGRRMEEATHQRNWRSQVRAEFLRRVESGYQLADHVGESWTSKPSPYGMEEWHTFEVDGCRYSHMVGTITGQTFEERLTKTQVLHEMHRRVCPDYTTYGRRS